MLDSLVLRSRSLVVLVFMLVTMVTAFAFGAHRAYATVEPPKGGIIVGKPYQVHATGGVIHTEPTVHQVSGVIIGADDEPTAAQTAPRTPEPLSYVGMLFALGCLGALHVFHLLLTLRKGIGTSPSEPVPVPIDAEITKPLNTVSRDDLNRARGGGIGTSPSSPTANGGVIIAAPTEDGGVIVGTETR